MVAGEARAPVAQHLHQPPVGEMGRHHILGQVGEAEAGDRRFEAEVGGGEHELALDPHPEFPAAFLELPGVEAAIGRQAQVDAAVERQVARGARPRAVGEVGGRADDRHPHVGADAHRDHVLRHLLAEADAGVVAPGDDVGQALVDVDLDGDVRIVGQQPRHRRPEDRPRRVLARIDADGARRLVAQRAQRRHLGLDLVEPRRERGEQALARRSRRDAAGGPCQQPDAEALLEAAHFVAERRLRHPELRRGAGEAALARDGHEGDEVVDVPAGHS